MRGVKLDFSASGDDRNAAAAIDSLVARRIAEVRRRFLEGLPDRLAEMSDARDKLEQVSARPGTHLVLTDSLRFDSHKIAGIASTLGFEDLGQLARDSETAAELFEREPGALDLEAVLAVLDDMLDAMAAILADEARLRPRN